MTPWVGPVWTQGLGWQELWDTKHCYILNKYISSGPHGFREEDFLIFSHYKSMGAND